MLSFLKNKKNYIERLSTLYSIDNINQILGWLCEKVSEKSLSYLLVHSSFFTSEHEVQVALYVDQLVNQNYPLQYILGTVTFGNVAIQVEPPVLIPRPETEEWVYKAFDELQKYKDEPLKILDLCTGSGCIAIAAASYFKNAQVDAVDLYQKPLELSQKNVLLNKCENVTIIKSDLFSNLIDKKYDLIFTNPPYIGEAVWQTLSLTVKEWEDKNALVADHNGLALYERIISELSEFLKQDSVITDAPRFYTEIGYDQGNTVSLLLVQAGFAQVAVSKDFAGKDRVVSA